jgi:hypothetical protein
MDEAGSVLEAALDYAQSGWRVVRLYGVHRSKSGNLICDCRAGYKCRKSGKHPNLGEGWQYKASTDTTLVSAWWDEFPNSNVGILMGEGLITVDLDLLKAGHRGMSGLEEWQMIQEHCGPAPETRTARTGSGGLHFIYREPPGCESGGSLLPALSGAENIDQRGKHGLIVVAPSLHKSGNRYQWENNIEPALAPEWLYTTPGPFYGKARVKKSPKAGVPKSASTRANYERNVDPDIETRVKELTRRVDRDAVLGENTLKLICEGRSGDQSGLIFAICLGAAAVQFDFTKLFKLLEDPAHRGGLRLRREIEANGPERAIEWFAITWEAAQRHRASQLAMIDQLREEEAHFEWPKSVRYRARSGAFLRVRSASMRLVLHAVFDLASRYTTTEPMLSQKLIAEMTKKDIKTVRKALGALEVLGWMERQRQTGVFGADIYSLVLDPEVRRTRLSSPALAEGTFDLLLGLDTKPRDDPSKPLMAL